MQWLRHPIDSLSSRLGGADRARVILSFAAVLGLDGADKGSIGAMAGPLRSAFHVGQTDLGLLLTVSLLIAAAATFPFGWLVDRHNRIRLLSRAVAGWGTAMAISAAAPTYRFPLWSRAALGAVSACAGPAAASLVGDEFPSAERASVYGSVLTGEIVGTGIAFLVSGELAAWSWRAAFIALAIPAGFLAWFLRRIPEP
jgi:MFS family permease